MALGVNVLSAIHVPSSVLFTRNYLFVFHAQFDCCIFSVCLLHVSALHVFFVFHIRYPSG